MTNDELQSKTIAFLRFPLIVGVVLIHCYYKELPIGGVKVPVMDEYPIYKLIADLFSQVLARTAVPLFFLISGYLFFYKSSFSWPMYGSKLRKRAQTLLLPYLFWNGALVGLHLLIELLFPSVLAGEVKPVLDYGWCDWWDIFWAREPSEPGGMPMPINYPLWFIRDLMVLVVFSPLVYAMVRYLRQYALALLGFLWLIYDGVSSPGLSPTAWFFFSLGAFYSVHRRNFVVETHPLLRGAALLYVVLALADLLSKELGWNVYVHNVGILVGCVFAISLSAYGLEKALWRTNSFLEGASFFVFASHVIVQIFIYRLILWFFRSSAEWAIIGIYFGVALGAILICLAFYAMLRRFLPRLLSAITGGR
ncbi:acyltransferase [Parabacteroides sp. AF27-14]|uniref:acyltransferase family protein n=1 Tax=Parabacteroides sp. AF27-14 TaxID=2293116 RepID=UPI000EFF050D|nr:acyltransferase [Parabacteroides sp. AF27-14]RKU58435.1 acyltransferase [Parabacteroides sp. AF27-14]